jgi:hypothetical protein
MQWLVVLAAASTAGAMNAVAGGGTFWLFPTLLACGLDPKTANATNTFALWIASTGSVIPYRKKLPPHRGLFVLLAVVSLASGFAGAKLLLWISAPEFRRAVPWLLLAATLVFAFGPALAKRFKRTGLHEITRPEAVALLVVQFVIGVYGGFFGAGIGILMLAAFSAFGMTDIHEMNALKVLLASVVNGVASVTFLAQGALPIPFGLTLGAAAAAGAWLGATAALRLPPARVRMVALAAAVGVTICFFLPTHLQPPSLRAR